MRDVLHARATAIQRFCCTCGRHRVRSCERENSLYRAWFICCGGPTSFPESLWMLCRNPPPGPEAPTLVRSCQSKRRAHASGLRSCASGTRMAVALHHGAPPTCSSGYNENGTDLRTYIRRQVAHPLAELPSLGPLTPGRAIKCIRNSLGGISSMYNTSPGALPVPASTPWHSALQ